MDYALRMIVGYLEEFDQKEVLSVDEIMDYAQWSGRLASCGYPEFLIKFFDRFGVFDLDRMIIHRASEGMKDLKEAFGEYLAVEIFTVQDFVCFVNHAPALKLKKETIDFINFWERVANCCPLDKDAADTLKAFKCNYTLKEADYIEKVADPMDAEEEQRYYNILHALTQPDIDADTEELSKTVEVRIAGVDFPEKGKVTLIIDGIDPKLIERVRQRAVPGLRAPNPYYWVFPFDTFGQKFDPKTVITIHTVSGGTMKKTINK